MTLSVTVSINGNYKTTYSVNGTEATISGRDHDGPNVRSIHISEPTTIIIQPDEYDPPDIGSQPETATASDDAQQNPDDPAGPSDEGDEEVA